MTTNKKRAKKLLKQMTLKEKIGQLAQNFYGFDAYTRDEQNNIVLTEEFKNYVQQFGGLGMLNNFFRADPWSKRSYENGGIRLEEREHAYNILQKYVIENTRLKIPVLIEEDCPHGRQVLDSVLYPLNINVGCSFDPQLFEKQTYCIGKEAKLGGVYVPYLSVFDMLCDARWGRSEECFSEDPFLAAKLAESAVKGVNKSDNMVCCKHYLAQGSALGGHNGGISVIGEREMREIHLPAVKSAVDAGCDFIMTAYNEIDGLPCHSNKYLLRDVLRKELGFEGVNRSDGCAINNLRDFCGGDIVKAGAVALNAGVDCGLWDEALPRLDEAVKLGYVKEKTIDAAVLRLLERKFKCGIMDKPYLDENGQSVNFVLSGEGQKIALQMASESLVLLKNDTTLPLKPSTKVLLIGENLDSVYHLLGDYTSPRADGAVKTVLDRAKETFANVDYVKGWQFGNDKIDCDGIKNKINDCDVVILGVGGSSVRDFFGKYNSAGAAEKSDNVFMDCGEGQDLSSLQLPDCQLKTAEFLAQFNKPIVSLVVSGRPCVLNEICNVSSAVIWCGYPGQEGAQAITDAVCGRTNCFGRLSFSLPQSVGQLPINYNKKLVRNYVDIEDKPLYPFGYGLSYSQTEYKNFIVTQSATNEFAVTLTICNNSDLPCRETVQLYVQKSGGTISHRIKELKGFASVQLDAHQEKSVNITVGINELQDWNVNKKYTIDADYVVLMVGKSSDEILFAQQVTLCKKIEKGNIRGKLSN